MASEAEFGLERESIQPRDKLAANRFDVMLSRTRRGSTNASVVSALDVQITDSMKLDARNSWRGGQIAFTAKAWL